MSSLVGKTFTITGKLDKLSRADAVAKAALLGARFVEETSGKCDFVVRGDKLTRKHNTPKKLQQAETAGISIIPATQFYHFLATSSTPPIPSTSKIPAMEDQTSEVPKELPTPPASATRTEVPLASSAGISFKEKSVMVMPGLTHMSQIHAMFRLEQVGAFNVTKVDKADYVIINPSTGKSHIKAAEKKGVKLVEEEDFYRIVGFHIPKAEECTVSSEVPSPVAASAESRISIGTRRDAANQKAQKASAPTSRRLKKSEKTRVYDGVKVAPSGPITGEDAMAKMSEIPRSLEGKKIFFTGDFATGLLGRTALAHKCGAMVTQHLTNEVDFVVCGSFPSKALLDQAVALEIPLSDEADFNKKAVAIISEGILLNSLPQVSAEVEAKLEKSMLTQAPEPATPPLNVDFKDGEWNVVPESPAPEI